MKLMQRNNPVFGIVVLALTLPASASASWTAINLHPVGSGASVAYGGSGAGQVGSVTNAGLSRATRWSGSAGSLVDLHPSAASTSVALGASTGSQVGNASVGGVVRASLWTGTAASWVDLNPAGSTQSQANGVSGTIQVGVARVSNVFRASLWTGTAASWVSLHPASATGSVAEGASGANQVGFATLAGGLNRASLWSGTAASWVNLHPPVAGQSVALGVSGGSQVGYATLGNFNTFNASLWSGTAASWVNLHPAGSTGSSARGVLGSLQVGEASLSDGWSRASLWSGTAASWVNLQDFLPAGYRWSRANAISSDGTNFYISGVGFNLLTGREEALLWTRLVNPAALSGTVTLGDWLPNEAGQPVTIQVRPVGSSTVLATLNTTLSAGGIFSVVLPSSITPGTYDFACRGSHWVRRKRASVVVSAAGATGVNFTLFNGDADASGEVDAADIDLVIADFGGNGIMTDLDGSTEVDAADIDIAIANFGQSDE